jgi:hypothetical protein
VKDLLERALLGQRLGAEQQRQISGAVVWQKRQVEF